MTPPIRVRILALRLSTIPLAFVACGGSTPPPHEREPVAASARPPTAPAAEEPKLQAPAPMSAMADASSSAPEDACTPLQWVKDVCVARPRPVPDPVDAKGWIDAHGGKASAAEAQLHDCRSIEAGPKREPALLCAYSYGGDVEVFGRRIVAVRHKKVVQLFDVVERLQEMPVAPPPPGAKLSPPDFIVSIDASRPEREIVVSLPAPDACTQVKGVLDAGDPEKQPSLSASERQALSKSYPRVRKAALEACAAAKTYVWKGDRYKPE